MFPRAALAVFTLACAVGPALANNVLNVNPTVADADLTTHGSDWLWAVFAIMLSTALGVTIWAFFVPAGKRAFHWIGIAILFTASIAYFSMASDLGATPVYVEFVRYSDHLYTGPLNPYTRSIWYARYIDWTITTPLLLLELLLSTGMPLSGIFATIFFDLAMIIGGLIGALVPSVYKWGYFTGATVAMLYVFWTLMFPARTNAKALGDAAHKVYFQSALVLAVLWLLYPVAWGVADGGNVISTDSEMIFYGVLDILAKPVFLIFHLLAMRKIPYELYELQSGHYSAYASVGPKGGVNTAASSAAGQPITQEKRPLGRQTPAAGNVTSVPATGADTVAHGAPQTGTFAGQMHVVGDSARTSDVTAV